MENASKALTMAAGIFIAILLITVLVVMYNVIGNKYSEDETSLSTEQLAEYNKKFAVYNNVSGLYGSEILSLANLSQDFNTKLATAQNYPSTTEAESANDTYYKTNKIEIEVKISSIVGGTITDNDGSSITNVQSQMLKEYLRGKISGTYSAEQLIAFNTELTSLSKTSSDAKSLLRELRESVFRCDTSKTEYNEYGRITYMYFEKE